MFKTLFGDITDGRLRRLQFLGYSLFLVLLMIGFGLAVVMAIGAGEQLIGGDLQQAQDKLREWFTLPFLIVLGLVLFVLLFAHLNITAKRIRDIGLPGWWTVLGIAVLTRVVSGAVSNQAGSGLSNLIWLALVLIPGNAFAKGR